MKSGSTPMRLEGCTVALPVTTVGLPLPHTIEFWSTATPPACWGSSNKIPVWG
ncbi:MAG: hypothetical protein HC897_04365 [Thermoanaerobaculia bacterium]|nr:hypothetical protein [Thermoanaerobaculia bacterium]